MTEIVRSLESTATPVPGQPSVVVTPWAVDRCITLGSSRGNATHVDRVAVTDLMALLTKPLDSNSLSSSSQYTSRGIVKLS